MCVIDMYQEFIIDFHLNTYSEFQSTWAFGNDIKGYEDYTWGIGQNTLDYPLL